MSLAYSPTSRPLSPDYPRLDEYAMEDTVDRETRRLSESEKGTDTAKATDVASEGMMAMERRGLKRFWDRFSGKERRKVGVLESLKNFALSSCKSSQRLCPNHAYDHLQG